MIFWKKKSEPATPAGPSHVSPRHAAARALHDHVQAKRRQARILFFLRVILVLAPAVFFPVFERGEPLPVSPPAKAVTSVEAADYENKPAESPEGVSRRKLGSDLPGMN